MPNESMQNEKEEADRNKAIVDHYSTTVDSAGKEKVDESMTVAKVVEAAPVVAEEIEVEETPVEVQGIKRQTEAPVAPAVEVPEVKAAAIDLDNGGFEIELAPDSPLSEKDLDNIFAIAETKNLTKEETMQLISDKEQMYTRGRDTIMNQAKTVLKAQEDEYNADPLFNKPEVKIVNEALIDSVIEKFGSAKLKEKFKSSHLKNDVELARILRNIGEAMSGDEIRMAGVGTHQPTVATTTQEDRLKAAYAEHF